MRLRLFSVLLAVLAFAALPALARADTINVTSTDDLPLSFSGDTGVCETGPEGGGPCTLRAAVELADEISDGSPETINLPAGTYHLTIPFTGNPPAASTGDLEIGNPFAEENTNLTIVGAGAGTTTIDASAIDDRAFAVDSGSSLGMSGVTVTGGDPSDVGGGILSDGDLSLDHSVVTGNHAVGAGGGIFFQGANLILDTVTVSNNVAADGEGLGTGGGVYFRGGFITIDHSTISGNQASEGGGIYEENVSAPIIDSTIANNTANFQGGGLYVGSQAAEDISFSTFSGNKAQGEGQTGGNIYVFPDEVQPLAGKLRLKGTLIAGGSPANCSGEAGTVTDVGHNYSDDDGTACGMTDPTDLLSQTGALGPLADNGGPTQTVALLTGNAAIDAVKNASDCSVDVVPEVAPAITTGEITTDQRGLSRPFGDGCDIGAFEQHDAAMTAGSGGANPATVDVGQQTTITQTVTDGGPAPGTNVVYTATLPAGTVPVSATATTGPVANPTASPRAVGNCSISGSTVTCPLGLVNTNPADPSDSGAGKWTVLINVTSSTPGRYSVTGHVVADQNNPNPGGAAASTPFTVNGPSVPPALSCTHRPLVLTDVFVDHGKVRLFGAADKSLVGQTVRIVFADRKTVASAKVQPNGFFATTAPLPPRSIRNTDKARYRAVVGTKKSLNLKLARRVVLKPLGVSGANVTLSGRVVAPLLSPRPKLLVQRRTSCKSFVTVKSFKMPASGRFKLTVPGTGSSAAAVYRIATKVRLSKRINRSYPSFSLPQVLGFG